MYFFLKKMPLHEYFNNLTNNRKGILLQIKRRVFLKKALCSNDTNCKGNKEGGLKCRGTAINAFGVSSVPSLRMSPKQQSHNVAVKNNGQEV